MEVRELMNDHVKFVDSAACLEDAARLMRDTDVGALPVFESGRLTGIVTDRDIVVRGIAAGRDPNSTNVREIMTPRVACVYEDDDASEAFSLMQHNGVRRLVVLDHDQRLVGMLSTSDLFGGPRDTDPQFAGPMPEAPDVPRSLAEPSDS